MDQTYIVESREKGDFIWDSMLGTKTPEEATEYLAKLKADDAADLPQFEYEYQIVLVTRTVFAT